MANGTYDVRVTVAPTGFAPMAQVWLGSAFGDPFEVNNNNGVFDYQPDHTGGQAPDPIVVNNNTQTTRLVVTRDNNPFPPVCGLDIALVIDRSGSTQDFQQTYEDAAKAFVTALVGTPSNIGVWTFGSTALAGGIAMTSVNAQGPAPYDYPGGLIHQAIDNLPNVNSNASTNWDEGISQAAGKGADVVVVITDGNPTSQSDDWDADAQGSGGTVNVYDVEGGVASANLVKSQGARVIAVGIGDLGGDPQVDPPTNIVNISGPDGTGEERDFYLGDISDLTKILKGIAEALCGGSITVVKQVPAGKSADDWQFTAASDSNVPIVANPGNGQTDIIDITPPIDETLGAVNFNYDNNGNVTATITETVKPNWVLETQAGDNAVCKLNGQGPEPSGFDNVGETGVKFTLGPTDQVTCYFKNKPASAKLTLRKKVINDNGGTKGVLDFGITTSAPGALTPWDSDGGSPTTVPASQTLTVDPGTYDLSENDVQGYGGRLGLQGGEGRAPARRRLRQGLGHHRQRRRSHLQVVNDDIAIPGIDIEKTTNGDDADEPPAPTSRWVRGHLDLPGREHR